VRPRQVHHRTRSSCELATLRIHDPETFARALREALRVTRTRVDAALWLGVPKETLRRWLLDHPAIRAEFPPRRGRATIAA